MVCRKLLIKTLCKCSVHTQWVEQSKKVFKCARELGIMTNAMFIIGNPNETEEDVWKSIKLAKELEPDMIQISFFTPYPGSSSYKLFEENIKNTKTETIQTVKTCRWIKLLAF